jgi:hypothetical protein
MKSVGLLLGFLALTLLFLPGLTAQEKKGDDAKKEKAEAKDEKKDTKGEKKDVKDEKKDAKDDKGDPEKKDTEKKDAKKDKEKKPVENMPEHGQVIKTKIISMRAESAREFTIEMPVFDPQRAAAMQAWQVQQMQQIMANPNPQRLLQFKMDLARKEATEMYTMKPVDLKMAEHCKLRVMFPPMQYDDAGHAKKWSKKELDALRGNSKLPGYPAEFDVLRPGQMVEVYLAKQSQLATPKDKDKGAPQKKKKKSDDDPPELPEMRPEVVLIVIHSDPAQK